MTAVNNLTDRCYAILKTQVNQPLTFQEFRAQYSSMYNDKNPPERSKLMKVPIVKTSYSSKHKKQSIKLLIELDHLCDCNHTIIDCKKLHILETSDLCPNFEQSKNSNQKCPSLSPSSPTSSSVAAHEITCDKIHIPSISLHDRILHIFQKSGRSRMPFSKFIVLHRTIFPNLRDHHPTNDILCEQFSNIVTIDTTDKTKEIRLKRKKSYSNSGSLNNMNSNECESNVPSISDNSIDAPRPSLKILHFDEEWTDTETIVKELQLLFPRHKMKDVFIPGHMRMAFVTMATTSLAMTAVKKLHEKWCFGRKVSVTISERRLLNTNHEKIADRVCIKPINNIINERDIEQWMQKIGKIEKIELFFVPCKKSANHCYIHFKSYTILKSILNKKTKKMKLRGKSIQMTACNDGYTDPGSYYTLNTIHSRMKQKKSEIMDEYEQKMSAIPHRIKSNSNDIIIEDKKTDSMVLLSQRLNSLMMNVTFTNNDLKMKLKVLSSLKIEMNSTLISNQNSINQRPNTKKKNSKKRISKKMKSEEKIENNSNSLNVNAVDIGISSESDSSAAIDLELNADIALYDETYTIDALKLSLQTLKHDTKQIQVYKQALNAFEQSQSRNMLKAQQELQIVSSAELKLAKKVKYIRTEVEELQKQLLDKQSECESVNKCLQQTRCQSKQLKVNVEYIESKLQPIRDCLLVFSDHKMLSFKNKRSSNAVENQETFVIPSERILCDLEKEIGKQEKYIQHWLNWKMWNLAHATKWISGLENGRFKIHLQKFNALSKISQGSILNAITDPTLQIIGISDAEDRGSILTHIALLKSRTAMMKNSQKKFELSVSPSARSHRRSRSLSAVNTDIVTDVKNSALCVICLDQTIAPYAMVPCGHQCLCITCKDLIKPSKQKCPMCNGAIQMIIKLFRA